MTQLPIHSLQKLIAFLFLLDTTPLMVAVEGKASINLVKLLLNEGTDSNAIGVVTTPLLLSC